MKVKNLNRTHVIIGGAALVVGLLGGWLGASQNVPGDCVQALEYAGDIEFNGKELAHTLHDIRSTRVGSVIHKISSEADNLDKVERAFDRAVEDFSAAEESCLG